VSRIDVVCPLPMSNASPIAASFSAVRRWRQQRRPHTPSQPAVPLDSRTASPRNSASAAYGTNLVASNWPGP
jgi:hypothetical protein